MRSQERKRHECVLLSLLPCWCLLTAVRVDAWTNAMTTTNAMKDCIVIACCIGNVYERSIMRTAIEDRKGELSPFKAVKFLPEAKRFLAEGAHETKVAMPKRLPRHELESWHYAPPWATRRRLFLFPSISPFLVKESAGAPCLTSMRGNHGPHEEAKWKVRHCAAPVHSRWGGIARHPLTESRLVLSADGG